jgi:hypothetical protein
VKRQADSAPRPFSFSNPFFIGCIVFFLLPIAACIGFRPTSWAMILLRVPDFVSLFLWLAAALGFGSAILKLTGLHRQLCGILGIVSAVALGLGVMSLLVLAMGLCVRMGAAAAWAMLLLGLVAGTWAREVWRVVPKWDSGTRIYRWLLLPCAAAMGLATVEALVPPGVLWGDEPNGYDVLEYHLQVPREWYEIGRIVPLRHNVFSFFPFNVEMHYLLAMSLRGGPWAGMYLAQLMHVAFIALTVLAVYALVAQRSKPMAIIAATAVATVPWMGLLAPVAYDEGGLLLWGTLAIGLSLRSFDDWRTMALAGAMAGFACGSKLTAVPILLLAVPLVHVVLAGIKPKAIVAAASFLFAGGVIFSPWLIRNITWTGNPVFPEVAILFGRAHWSQTQVERWIKANHLPRPEQQNILGRAKAAGDQVLWDWRFGYVLLPIAIAAAALAWKDRQTKVLVALLIGLAIFWLFFTHLQSRFFTLAIPICALLIGQAGARRGEVTAYSLLVLVMACGGVLALFSKVASIKAPIFDFLGVENLNGLTPLADASIPADAHVLLVGDGRPFLYEVPTDRLLYRTVFDVDVKDGEASDVAWRSGWDSNAGPTIQVIDAPELRRFAKTYWGIPEPSDRVMRMRDATVQY